MPLCQSHDNAVVRFAFSRNGLSDGDRQARNRWLIRQVCNR